MQGEEVLVSDGLAPGERVCVSALEAVVEGMRVTPLTDRDETTVAP